MFEQQLGSQDGHAWTLSGVIPDAPRCALLWLPALGVAARHYLPFAQAMAERGVAVFLHEWRGNGSSNLRPDRMHDWGYRQILGQDLPASLAAVQARLPGLRLLAGGHSLGGQLATCFAGLHPDAFAGLWLVASGSPYWRSFPGPRGWMLPFLYRFLPWLARRRGRLNGRRIGFGGLEARSLIADWARVGLCNRYAAAGMDVDLEAAMSALHLPCHGIVLQDDWLAPASSLQVLTQRLGGGERRVTVLDAGHLGCPADHFAWMRQPGAVASALSTEA